MCSRAVDLIPSLMERIENFEAEKVALIEQKTNIGSGIWFLFSFFFYIFL